MPLLAYLYESDRLRYPGERKANEAPGDNWLLYAVNCLKFIIKSILKLTGVLGELELESTAANVRVVESSNGTIDGDKGDTGFRLTSEHWRFSF